MELMELNEESALKNVRKLLHDLAQPLAAITGTVDLLLLETDEADPAYKELEMISNQLQQVLDITAEIRRLTRDSLNQSTGLPA
jgi:signal transduction histidine kinase